MNIEEIYKDKFTEICEGMAKAYNHIAKAINKDKNYTLADDEMAELIFELIGMNIKNNQQ